MQNLQQKCPSFICYWKIEEIMITLSLIIFIGWVEVVSNLKRRFSWSFMNLLTLWWWGVNPCFTLQAGRFLFLTIGRFLIVGEFDRTKSGSNRSGSRAPRLSIRRFDVSQSPNSELYYGNQQASFQKEFLVFPVPYLAGSFIFRQQNTFRTSVTFSIKHRYFGQAFQFSTLLGGSKQTNQWIYNRSI